MPWRTILISAATLAVIASVDCLLTAVVADEATGERHDARKELTAQGIGQLFAGLLGGVGGGGTKGSTLVTIKTGGRRWATLVSGLTFTMLLLFLGPVGSILPISVLAGVLIYVGVGLVEWHILHWLRRPQTRLDGIIALLVVATTLACGLMDAVAIGVLGSTVLFLRGLVGARVIHERATGTERRSLQLRIQEEARLLDTHGERIVYVELRGNLFFGTADRLFNELLPDLDRPVWMILNLRRVQYLDISGLHLFQQMIKRLHAHGVPDVLQQRVQERCNRAQDAQAARVAGTGAGFAEGQDLPQYRRGLGVCGKRAAHQPGTPSCLHAPAGGSKRQRTISPHETQDPQGRIGVHAPSGTEAQGKSLRLRRDWRCPVSNPRGRG